MTRPGHVFHLLEIIRLALRIATPILLRQVHHFLFIIFPHELPDNLLGDIPADVLIVVALAPHLLLLDLAEDAQAVGLVLVPIVIIGQSLRVAEDDVVGDSQRGRFEHQGAISVWDLVEIRQQSADE